jgi:hypothetical protein
MDCGWLLGTRLSGSFKASAFVPLTRDGQVSLGGLGKLTGLDTGASALKASGGALLQRPENTPNGLPPIH